MRINHTKEGKVSDNKPVFDNFKQKSDTEQAKRVQAVQNKIVQLACALNELLTPGATIIVNVDTKKVTKTNDGICIVMSKPSAVSSINMVAELQPKKDEPAVEASIEPVVEEAKAE